MKYIKSWSLLVLCWQTFLILETISRILSAETPYPVIWYYGKRVLVFRGEKILQFCTDKVINCLQKFVSSAAF